MKSSLLLGLVAACSLLSQAAAQDDRRFTELQFHRVHLRNGNFLDGELLKQTDKLVLLRVPSGEMTVRMDLVDRVEFVKMKSYNEAPNILANVPASSGATKNTPPPPIRPRTTPAITSTSIKLDPQTEEAVQAALADYFKADIELRQSILNKLIGMGGNVPAYLVSIISRFERDQVGTILQTVSQTKDAGLIPVLAAHLESSDTSLRQNVIMAMGAIGNESAIPYLSVALKDADPAVRSAAVTAIALTPAPSAFDALLPLVGDADKDTRRRVIATLHEQATKYSRQRELADAISNALRGGSDEARMDLIDAAARGNHRTLWGALTPLLREDSAEIRRVSALALGTLAVPESADAVLSAVLTEKTESVRTALAGTVQKLGILKAGGTLISWMEQGTIETKLAAKSALSALAGQNLGDDLLKWKEWWEKNQPQ